MRDDGVDIAALHRQLLAFKPERRKQMAKLPIHEKVKIIVEMQKRVAPILEAQGKRAVVWEIES